MSLSKDEIKLLTDKIISFAEELADMKARSYQIKFMSRIVDSLLSNEGAEISILISRQAGKSEGVAMIVRALLILLPELAKKYPELSMYKNGFWVGIYAPKEEQAALLHKKIKATLRSKKTVEILEEAEVNIKINARVIELSNGSRVWIQSAGNNANVEGATHHLIICDECQDISEMMYSKSLRPMLSTNNGTMVSIGTPNGKPGVFYDLVTRNRKNQIQKNGKNCHFEFDYRVCQKENPYYKKYIAGEKLNIGEDSDWFRMAYKLDWLIEHGLFISESVWDALEIAGSRYGISPSYNKGTIRVAGLDLAKQMDSTVCTVLELDLLDVDENGFCKKKILNWLELKGMDYESQYREILSFLTPYDISRLGIDATGVGDPVADYFINKLSSSNTYVDAIKMSAQMKSVMYRTLHSELTAKRIIIPCSAATQNLNSFKKFKYELLTLQKNWKGDILIVHHPDNKNAHDDYPDSLCLAVWEASEASHGSIEINNNNLFLNNGSKNNPLYKNRKKSNKYKGRKRIFS